MKFKHITDEELQSLFIVDPGVYDFEVTAASDRISKNGNEMIELKLKIWDKKGNERIVFDYLLEAMKFKLKHFAECVGLEDKYNSDEIEASDCIGKMGKVDIIIQQGQPNMSGGYYPDKNAVKDYVKSDKNMVQAQKANENLPFDDVMPF